ncbi:MAG: helix-turn-helix transcriptional regulator [Solobacterium sp.]|nr:helix-turn-helix transcriptional regulator [Solobacterium sp.]
MNAEKTGKLIQEIRKEKGLSQNDLAGRLHVSRAAVSKWERGQGQPDIAMLEPLADELGIAVTELMDGERKEHVDKAHEQQVQELLTMNDSYARRYDRLVIMAMLMLLILAAVGIALKNAAFTILCGILLCIFAAYEAFTKEKKKWMVWLLAVCSVLMGMYALQQAEREEEIIRAGFQQGTYIPADFSHFYVVINKAAGPYYCLEQCSELTGTGTVYGTYTELGNNMIRLDCDLLNDPVLTRNGDDFELVIEGENGTAVYPMTYDPICIIVKEDGYEEVDYRGLPDHALYADITGQDNEYWYGEETDSSYQKTGKTVRISRLLYLSNGLCGFEMEGHVKVVYAERNGDLVEGVIKMYAEEGPAPIVDCMF